MIPINRITIEKLHRRFAKPRISDKEPKNSMIITRRPITQGRPTVWVKKAHCVFKAVAAKPA
jgi:hypothetical protein